MDSLKSTRATLGRWVGSHTQCRTKASRRQHVSKLLEAKFVAKTVVYIDVAFISDANMEIHLRGTVV